jgi:hypothetical protein
MSGHAAVADATTGSAGAKTKEPSHWSKAPVRIASVCAALVVGTPVCFVRKLPQEAKQGAEGLAGSIFGETHNRFLLIPAGLLWFPAASAISAMEAPGYALRDAWMADQPFSKEQFSLGALDLENSK